MKLKKTGLASVVVILAATAYQSATAKESRTHAADIADSTFEACKGVTLIDAGAYKKNKAYWDKERHDCGSDQVQILSDTGIFKTNLMKILNGTEFLGKIADRTKKNLQGNIALLRAGEACTSGKGDSGAQAQLAEASKAFGKKMTCEEIVGGTRKTMQAHIEDYLFERARLVNIGTIGNNSDFRKFVGGDSDYVNALIPEAGVPSGAYMPSVVHDSVAKDPDPIVQDFPHATHFTSRVDWEFAQHDRVWDRVSSSLISDMGQIRKDWEEKKAKSLEERGKSLSDQPDAKAEASDAMESQYFNYARGALEQKARAHQMNYFNILDQVPLFSVLPKGNPTDEELAKGFGKIREAAEKELARVDHMMEGTSFPLYDEMGNPLGADGEKVQNGEDLLSLMKNLPVVEQVLKSDKADCGTATSLVNYMTDSEIRGGLISAGAWIIPFGSIGKLSRVAKAVGLVGRVEVAGAAMGAGLGVGMTASSYVSAKQEQNETIEGFQAGTKSAKQMADVRTVAGVIASAPLNFIGIGGLAGAGAGAGIAHVVGDGVAEALVKKGYNAQTAKALLQAANAGDKPAQKLIKTMFADEAKKILGTSRPEEQETALADAMFKKGMSTDNVKSFFDSAKTISATDRAKRRLMVQNALKVMESASAQQGKQAFDSPERRQSAVKGIAILAKYTKVEDPAEIAAIYTNWPEKGVNGLNLVLQDAEKLKGKMSFAERFKKAAEEDGIDAEKACACVPFCGKSGATKAVDNSDIRKLIEKEKISVCVQSGSTIWYHWVKADIKDKS